MDKTPAACAMDWSIDLEKGLRSNNPPGKRLEAIREVGARLELWNKEPKLTLAEHDMFGLVLGEDKLFANAILLRLADAFMLGDKHTKLCVVKVFMLELRHREKKKSFSRQRGCILSRSKVENHMELLRRVKTSFNSGDEEVRALALVLFGCWSDFANDSAEIRYLILSSIVSGNALEVKASLFAAGCFCELSDDFASVLLEILVNMILSSDVLIAHRVAGVRAFSKLGGSSALAIKAYEEGLKLVLGFVEENLVINMLISLSKIASRSTLLISKQVDLLFTFLSQDKTLPARMTSLRCLHFILASGPCNFSPSTDLINAMFSMLKGELPPSVQRDTLHVLYKILMCNMLRFTSSEMCECFTNLLTVVKVVMHSQFISNRLLVVHVLADVAGKFTRRSGMFYDGDTNTLASQAISFIMARVTLLVKSMMKLHQPDVDLEQEIRSLLKLLSLLLNECPYLGEFYLDKIYLFIKDLPSTDDPLIEFGNDCRKIILSKLLICVLKVVLMCLKNLEKAGDPSSKFQSIVKVLVEDVHQCSIFGCYAHTLYSLLLHPHLTCHCMSEEIEEHHKLDGNLNTCDHETLIQNKLLALESAKKILAVKDNWSAYKAGKYAALQGEWVLAAFLFGELITVVKSDLCRHWLTSLAFFAYSEIKVQSLSLRTEWIVLLNWLDSNRTAALPLGAGLGETCKTTTDEMSSHHCIESLDEVCRFLRSSEELLGANGVTSRHHHYFQIQFLHLRAKVIETVVDIFKLLGTVPSKQDNSRSKGQTEGSATIQSLGYLQHAISFVHPLTQLSTCLMMLAREYDLVATSFFGMDNGSSMIISALALNCSILAFITGFSLFFTNIHSPQPFANLGSKKLAGSFHAALIHDLEVRLRHIDHETSRQLQLLLKICCGQCGSCYVPFLRNHSLENTYEVRRITKISHYAVMGVVRLQNAANRLQDNNNEVLLQMTNDGLLLLLDVVTKCISVSFGTPTHFFRVRPCVSCQLFAMNRDSKSSDRISVMSGYHLHLDLCLQLTYISSESLGRLAKLYCILQCKTSYQLPCESGDNERQTESAFCDWGAQDTLALNEKLVRYVHGCTKISNIYDKDDSLDGRIAETYISFEPNGKGQGFSTCLLDVSMFPLGTYQIKWHAVCVDNDKCYWSLPSLNSGPVFTVQKSSLVE